ncbi:hypothetical protein SNE40_003937 [Patella caerulea]|uniref:Uncharacterized protein n=1 Tax=Patella caerulea TaxID=87958 RepID=A0AAN8KCJ0_PATCE
MSDLNDLFRVHPRLSKKLSNDELRGIKQYVDQQVFHQSEKIISRLLYLETQADVNKTQHEKDIETLSSEIKQEKTFSLEYKREFTSLSNILHARDARHQQHRQKLEDELRIKTLELEDSDIRCTELKSTIHSKDRLIAEHKETIAELETMCLKLVKEREDSNEINRLSNDILKLKYSISNKDRALNNLRKQLDTTRPTVNKMACDGIHCSSAKYLQECKTQLIAKCEETAILNFQIEEGKRKLKEQKKILDGQLL